MMALHTGQEFRFPLLLAVDCSFFLVASADAELPQLSWYSLVVFRTHFGDTVLKIVIGITRQTMSIISRQQTEQKAE
jgi:hypothetical protein